MIKTTYVYPTTSKLAELVKKKDFDGIFYKGVRQPSNGSFIGNALALYNWPKEKIKINALAKS